MELGGAIDVFDYAGDDIVGVVLVVVWWLLLVMMLLV